MPHVFVSHVEEDGDTALSLSSDLEAAGFQTWYYERDAVPGVSYLVQVGDAIDTAQAVVLLISTTSLGSHQVTTEVVRAHEASKPILPVLLDVSHVEFQSRQPEWRAAVGAATSISVAPRGVAAVAQALVAGLLRLGVQRGAAPSPAVAQATHHHQSTQPVPSFVDDLAAKFDYWMKNYNHATQSDRMHLLEWLVADWGADLTGEDYALFEKLAAALTRMGYDTSSAPPKQAFLAKVREHEHRAQRS
jgi:hypothetical protein